MSDSESKISEFRFWSLFFSSLAIVIVINIISLFLFIAPIQLEGGLDYESSSWKGLLLFAQSVAQTLLKPIFLMGDFLDVIPLGDFDMLLTYMLTPILEAFGLTYSIKGIRILMSRLR